MRETKCTINCANSALIKTEFDLVNSILSIPDIWSELDSESKDFISTIEEIFHMRINNYPTLGRRGIFRH